MEGQADAGGYALNAADLTLENARQLVRYQAEEAYWGLVHRQDLVKVAKDAVDRSNIQLQLIDAQYDEGAVAKADVLIMQVRLANHRQNLVTAEGNLKVAKATLASIVGLPQDTDLPCCTGQSHGDSRRNECAALSCGSSCRKILFPGDGRSGSFYGTVRLPHGTGIKNGGIFYEKQKTLRGHSGGNP